VNTDAGGGWIQVTCVMLLCSFHPASLPTTATVEQPVQTSTMTRELTIQQNGLKYNKLILSKLR